MQSRPAKGEVLLALVFLVLGLMWVVTSFGMPLWEGFAPQSGFMPLCYGALLAALAVAILINLFMHGSDKGEQPIGKPLIVLAAFAAGIAGIEPAGFAPAMFLLLLVLFVAVEKLPVVRSVLVAAGTTAVLLFVFKIWLGVRLPAGPLGI